LSKNDIQVEVLQTEAAVERFNELRETSRSVVYSILHAEQPRVGDAKADAFERL
jgi:hypothetical protein